MDDCKYTMEGIPRKKLFVFDDRLMIRTYGLFSNKLKNTITIPYSTIAFIDYGNSFSMGYLDFLTPDRIKKNNDLWLCINFNSFFDTERGKNRFEFSGQNELAKEIKNFIENRIKAEKQ